LADSLSIAFLVVLERLSPIERAVFLLREVFDYNYDDCPDGGQSPTNCRQILRRSRQHIAAQRPVFRFPISSRSKYSPIPAGFDSMILRSLMALLAKDVTYWSDGGGQVAAALKPLQGGNESLGFCWRFAANGFRHRLFTSSRLTDAWYDRAR